MSMVKPVVPSGRGRGGGGTSVPDMNMKAISQQTMGSHVNPGSWVCVLINNKGFIRIPLWDVPGSW